MGALIAPVTAVLLLLYLPGFFALRGAGLPRVDALASAPAFAIVICAVASIVCGELGIRCTWETFAVPVETVGAVVWATGAAVRWARGKGAGLSLRGAFLGVAPSRFSILCAACYLTAGILIANIFFFGTLHDPASYVQEYDNLHHLGMTRGFVDTLPQLAR